MHLCGYLSKHNEIGFHCCFASMCFVHKLTVYTHIVYSAIYSRTQTHSFSLDKHYLSVISCPYVVFVALYIRGGIFLCVCLHACVFV